MSNSQNIKPAKKCYEHLGGKLGELLLETFIEKKWIAKKDSSEKHLYITELGEKEFEKLGLDLSKIKSEVL
ncbi:ArsR family transcriptional regulator [Flavobacterium johnsoniae]|uniref:ArsR family transcriptional regulator n=1 Tax=Flavobacterium johnsoniae TaxID=986 RepID=UPI0025B1FD29|nr:ArsR family transcriptional regulator [Flavobacterium johnsoniae]WJS94325.1 ArsR family transcriptional regulator [Flavobacterium johnsoniae]